MDELISLLILTLLMGLFCYLSVSQANIEPEEDEAKEDDDMEEYK